MIAEPSMPDRRPSPGLSINLSSNNPFRNRAASPAVPSPTLQTPPSAGSRPMSRNPFLQTFEAEFNKEAAKNSHEVDMSATMRASPKKATFGSTAEELFSILASPLSLPPTMDRFKQFASRFADYPSLQQSNLTLDNGENKRAAPRAPPPRSGTLPNSGHRPSRSDEEERDKRPRGPPRRPPRPPPQSSPDRRENRRVRRNSESSMIDKGSLDPNEERRRRERRKDRDERAREAKSKSAKVKRPHGLDIIDKLDVSGIYGPSMIHHDGPYDAVQPHRNRKKDVRAPMQAFPVGSANNALGGSGPVNDKINLDQIHGRGAEGFTDFGSTEAQLPKRPGVDGRSVSFNPKQREDIIHGEESRGLGTSTFLDGAPASRAAIQQHEADAQKTMGDGGLGRKKSIAQRIRGISQPRRQYSEGGPRIMSPDARYGPGVGSPLYSSGPSNKQAERNPFFEDDYDDAYDRKGASIRVAESDIKDGPIKSPNSPGGRNPLTRAMTADSVGSTDESKNNAGSGFLGRMKSLKGGRRPRPERPT
ncbi:Pal1 cell morphology protein-domain-containing protein [Massariosphaeria phaeospora]|uniref:Pal1 cell morphology protein-domain-containing protein n=1 Tax=Massariosphaeria phaeospora TaxID=100035 RepID=A0A7C8MD02_9PLEO|nr:Pal1 cell morphology protein-domain-containing protein [Massariosphaeria phaeospora]